MNFAANFQVGTPVKPGPNGRAKLSRGSPGLLTLSAFAPSPQPSSLT